MDGIKHVIECHCVLPQHRRRDNPPYFNFIVFSVIDDSDTVVPKYAQCDNCGVVHKVVDLCRSEIISGKDEISSMTSIDDIKLMLPQDVVGVLESYSCSLASYEATHFILSNKRWGNFVVLTKDFLNDETQGKILQFFEGGKIVIESFVEDSTVAMRG